MPGWYSGRMRILCGPAQAELIVMRSRFLGLLEPVADPEEARIRLKEAKAEFSDATHVVHAFRTGLEGSETMGCSDDGEPSGTAGRPALDVLKGSGGGNALLLIVRWFGGTKLGTGGLVRAYGDTAKAVVGAALWQEFQASLAIRITVDWSEHRALMKELAALGATIEAETFSSGVTIDADVAAELFDTLQARTVDLTRGRARWMPKD